MNAENICTVIAIIIIIAVLNILIEGDEDDWPDCLHA